MIAYANGLPLLLTSKTLTIWLESFGLSYTAIGLFAFLHVPYSVKFLWAPLLDKIRIPFLTDHFGQRRSWLILAQAVAIACLYGLTFVHPVDHTLLFAILGLSITFAAATQHIIMLAWQMEILPSQEWGISEAMTIFGFRLAILTAGAGALRLAEYYSWQDVYRFLALLMCIGFIGVLISNPPKRGKNSNSGSKKRPLSQRFYLTYKEPLKNFMEGEAWQLILIFMFIYRLPDHFFGFMQNLFFLDLGFSKTEISNVVKIYGMCATILGGFIAGILIRQLSYQSALLISGLLHGLSYLMFILQAAVGYNLPLLYLTIGIEHLTGGMALTVFFSYQLTCTSLTYAATQLALMTSIVELSRVLCSSVSGFLIDQWGWTLFLVFVILTSIPGIILSQKLPFRVRFSTKSFS